MLKAFDFKMLRELALGLRGRQAGTTRSASSSSRARAARSRGRRPEGLGCRVVGNPRRDWKRFGAFKDMHHRLREIGKPTVARIQGIAAGGGNELQTSSDLAAMADDAFTATSGSEHGSVRAGG